MKSVEILNPLIILEIQKKERIIHIEIIYLCFLVVVFNNSIEKREKEKKVHLLIYISEFWLCLVYIVLLYFVACVCFSSFNN